MDTYDETDDFDIDDFDTDEGIKGGVRVTDPDTSHIAADKIDASRLIGIVYGIIAKYGERGCIGEEVVQALPHIRPQSISPRFSQMIDMGMLEVTGERRLASSGYPQIVRRIKLPPFIDSLILRYKPSVALSLLRSFPEHADTTEWNEKRKKFLGIE